VIQGCQSPALEDANVVAHTSRSLANARPDPRRRADPAEWRNASTNLTGTNIEYQSSTTTLWTGALVQRSRDRGQPEGLCGRRHIAEKMTGAPKRFDGQDHSHQRQTSRCWGMITQSAAHGARIRMSGIIPITTAMRRVFTEQHRQMSVRCVTQDLMPLAQEQI